MIILWFLAWFGLVWFLPGREDEEGLVGKSIQVTAKLRGYREILGYRHWHFLRRLAYTDKEKNIFLMRNFSLQSFFGLCLCIFDNDNHWSMVVSLGQNPSEVQGDGGSVAQAKGPKLKPQSPHKAGSTGSHLRALLFKVKWEVQTRESTETQD